MPRARSSASWAARSAAAHSCRLTTRIHRQSQTDTRKDPMSDNTAPMNFFCRGDVDRVGKVTVETRFGLARLNRCTPETLLAEGVLPFPLLQQVILLREQLTNAPDTVDDEQLRATLDVMRKIVCAASDKPRIV